jgi:hypothetical protein
VNVTTSYVLLHKAIAENGLYFSPIHIASILLASLSTIFLMIPIHFAVTCVDEIDKMPVIINKLLIIYQDSVILKNFSRQILHRPRVIKNRFFNIDCTWMFSVSFRSCFKKLLFLQVIYLFQILSSTLTFLIVAFQIGESSVSLGNFTTNTTAH